MLDLPDGYTIESYIGDTHILMHGEEQVLYMYERWDTWILTGGRTWAVPKTDIQKEIERVIAMHKLKEDYDR